MSFICIVFQFIGAPCIGLSYCKIIAIDIGSLKATWLDLVLRF